MTSQVIYVIKCASDKSDEKSLESAKISFFETNVSFKLPKLCLPYDSSCAVINGFIYVLTLDGGIDRLEARSK